uniref:MFS transporter n=1 Tax=Stenotrophomonas sp. GbtcB23 TaxID=2824768 RepID=UPI001C30F4A8
GGSWLWGVLSDGFGVSTALTLSSLAMVAGALIGLRLPLPQFSDLNLDPLNRFNAPLLRLDLQPRSGPIDNMVDYIIA